MARRLINRNRNSEQRQQSLLLDRLTVRFRGRVRRAIAAAMRDMINHWEQTSEVVLPRGYVDQIEAAYQAMAAASISDFAKRITGQAKSENIPLEIKESFAETMTRWAFDYIRAEMVRKRITSIADKRTKLWDMANMSTDLTINERRAMKGFEPIEGGDVVLVSAAQVPLNDMSGGDTTIPADQIKALVYGAKAH